VRKTSLKSLHCPFISNLNSTHDWVYKSNGQLQGLLIKSPVISLLSKTCF